MTRKSGPSAWRALWGYLRGSRLLLGGLLMLELVGGTAGLAQPLVAKWVLDALRSGGDLATPIAVLAVLAVVGVVFAGSGSYLLGRNAARLIARLRRDLVTRLLRTTVREVEDRPIGDLLSRVGSDTTLLQNTVGGALVQAAAAPLTVLAALVLMGTIDLELLGVVAVLLGLTTIGERIAARWVEDATEQSQHHTATMTSALHRALVAFRTVKASGTEQVEESRTHEQATAAYRAGSRAIRAEAVLEVIAAAAVDVTFLVVLVVGAARVADGTFSIDDLVAFLLYVIFLREPVDTLSFAVADIAEGLGAVRRLEQVRRVPEEVASTGRSAPFTSPTRNGQAPSVRFNDVWLAHRSQPVLRAVTFTATRGLTVLVGPSGTGKTTLLSLVERFVDPDQGRIELDGVDVRDWDRRELRRRLAYVQQEAPLLGDTVRAAILYGVPEPETVDLSAALRAVALDDWVGRLPDGLDTPVGERGLAVSGGQRQRLAVARALLRGADVLLLDEATSQLDPVSEQVLLTSIVREASSRIVIAATHRFAVAAEADQIVVLDSGGVRAIGKHAALLRTDADYRRVATAAGAVLPGDVARPAERRRSHHLRPVDEDT